jgi:HSP20 family protein
VLSLKRDPPQWLSRQDSNRGRKFPNRIAGSGSDRTVTRKRPFHSADSGACRTLETEKRRSYISRPKPWQAFEDRLPEISEALQMKALSFSNRNPLSNGNAAHSVIPGALGSFHHEMDRWLDDTFNGFGFKRGRSLSSLPTVEIQEADCEYRVAVDLPGVQLKDIELTFSEGLLALKGERPAAGGEALYSSRWSGPFERVVGVGPDVDEARIGARLENGVLTITLPKRPEWQPRRIEVQ